jgi:hypothetical protein
VLCGRGSGWRGGERVRVLDVFACVFKSKVCGTGKSGELWIYTPQSWRKVDG